MIAKHIVHLYNRVGFGITPKKVDTLSSLPKEEIVNQLLASSQNVSPLKIDTSFLNSLSRKELRNKSKRKELMKISRKKVKELNAVWINRLMNPTELLKEKMTLFWANHFVCEDKNVAFVLQYNNTLRTHALGNFADFIKAISKEAAMLKYLNNKQNKKANPNENFARELLELFTLGQGNYSEQDIKEAARAFTGYNHDFKGNFRLRRRQHDTGIKSFLGKEGYFNGDDIIDIILEQKQCAYFICEKIYRYFVNDTINQLHINEMVAVFYPSYNIKNLMQYILTSNWFYEDINIGTKIKSPIELLVGINTIVPYSFTKSKQQILLQKLLGQILLFPPNVAGWKEGRSWIDRNTIVTRLRLASILLSNAEINYSEKGDFEDNIRNFDERRLRRKAFIQTITEWNVFENNYSYLTEKELIEALIIAPITSSTLEFIQKLQVNSKQELCIQLLSLPEYQMC